MEKQATTTREEGTRTKQPFHLYSDQLAVVEVASGLIEPEEFVENPFYQRALCFLLISQGEINISIDFVPYRLGRNSGLIVHKNHMYDQLYPSQDFRGTLIIVDLDFIFSILHDEDTLSVKEILAIHSNVVHKFGENEMSVIWEIIERLRHNMKREEHRFYKSLIRNEFSNLLAELWEMGKPESATADKTSNDDYHEELAAHFLELLMNNCRKEHEIKFYAHELCVTPVYLSRAVKGISGKPASQWISHSILAVAKVLLRKPGVTVQEVAAELNFSDQSSFGKFFKKHLGISPQEYKQQ